MQPQVGLPLFLGITVALLVGVVATGLRGRLRAHLVLVALALTGLGLSIFFAERLGKHYDIKAAGTITPVHLTLAKITTVGYLLPLVTGAMTLRDRRRKRLHLTCAVTILVLTVLTTITGTWMLLAAPPI